MVKDKRINRTYLNLPEHTLILFTIKLWALDSWERNSAGTQQDHAQIEFDPNPAIDLFSLYWVDYQFLPSICGLDDRPEAKDLLIFGFVPHSGDSLSLKIISKMNANTWDESFGIREIKLLFSTSSISAPLCAIVPVQSYGFPNCTCSKGFYAFGFPSTICKECHPNCDSCCGPSKADCYECKEGNYFDGIGCTNCHSLCSRCFGPNFYQCLD